MTPRKCDVEAALRDDRRLRELILGDQAGFGEFLALLDGEPDASFLEALLHHLPMAETDSRQWILEREDLRRQRPFTVRWSVMCAVAR